MKTQITPLAQNTQMTDINSHGGASNQFPPNMPHFTDDVEQSSAVGIGMDNASSLGAMMVHEPGEDLVDADDDILGGGKLGARKRRLKGNAKNHDYKSRQADLTNNVSPNTDTNSSLPATNNLQSFIDQYSQNK